MIIPAATAGFLQVWNLTNCKLRHNLAGHTGYINTVTVSPDGSLCASGGKVRTPPRPHLPCLAQTSAKCRGLLSTQRLSSISDIPRCIRCLCSTPDTKQSHVRLLSWQQRVALKHLPWPPEIDEAGTLGLQAGEGSTQRQPSVHIYGIHVRTWELQTC